MISELCSRMDEETARGLLGASILALLEVSFIVIARSQRPSELIKEARSGRVVETDRFDSNPGCEIQTSKLD